VFETGPNSIRLGEVGNFPTSNIIRIAEPRWLWSPAAGSSIDELCPSSRVILVRLPAISNEPTSAVVPSACEKLINLERLASSFRHTTSRHYSWYALTPRFDLHADLRHPCVLSRPSDTCSTTWILVRNRNWFCFVDRYCRLLKMR
jgi:hypothetical protein